MEDVLLRWEPPMTSKQAQRYHMTKGFVAIELYEATLRELEQARKDLKRCMAFMISVDEAMELYF